MRDHRHPLRGPAIALEVGSIIQLRLVGGLDLRDETGKEVAAVLAHPKRTAVLAYLAVARPRGFHRRDSLIALFWPESPPDLARASLRKAVHHLRRALGEDMITGRGDEELGVAADRLWCDALAVEQATADGDVPRALELYGGPLLNGFFLAEVPAFERWLEDERARLRTVVFDGAWTYADRKAHEGDRIGAAVWARRAAALAPDDEGALRRLLGLLDRLGDRAGALSAYEDFARHLAREFDVEPAAETQALARAIRQRDAAPAGSALDAVRPAPARPPAREVAERAGPAHALPTPSAAPDVVAVAPPRGRRSRRALTAALGGIVALAVAWELRQESAGAPRPDSGSVAVLPFSFGGAEEYRYLGEGMSSLLATSLDGVGGLHTVDPNAILAAVSDRRALHDPEAERALATKLGATTYITGEVIEVAGRLRVSAVLYGARHAPQPLARASAEDTASQLFSVVDRIAAQLVTGRGTEPAGRLTRLAAVTTHSLPALKAYLEGERSFRIGHYKEAVDAFQRAVSADTTFALAYYRLASAYSWSGDTMAKPTALQAVRFADRLSPPDRMLVEAFVPFVQGKADEAERRYRAILSTRPYESEAWYPLGEVLFHYNPMRGRSIAEARPAFQRALTLGPTDAPLTHLLEIEAIDGNYSAFDTLLRGIATGAHFDIVGRAVRAFKVGTDGERAAILDEIRATPDPEIANTARHMLFLLDDAAGAERVVRLLLESQRPKEVRAQGWILLAHLRVAAGRWRDADSALDAAASLDESRALEHRGLLYALPFLPIPSSEREATRAALERWSGATGGSALVFTGDQALHPHFRLYLLGSLDAELERYEDAERASRDLERLPAPDGARPLISGLAHGVRARVAWRRREYAGALEELRQLRTDRAAADFLSIVPFFALMQERFLRAEVLRALGRTDEAIGWYSAFGEHSPYGRVYLAPAHLRLGDLFEKLGRPQDAAREYERFVTMWTAPEAELRPLVSDGRARLAKLRQR